MDAPVVDRKLLIAAPWLRDPNFERTVVLVCRDDEDGTLGLVLNRPLDVTLGDVLSDTISPARANAQLFSGGPVATDTVFALHDLASLHDESRALARGVRFALGTEGLLRVLRASPAEREVLRLYAGCAGWSPGQLQEELDENAWIVTRASRGLVFGGSHETLWRRALRACGGRTAWLETMPRDLRVN